MTSIVDQTITDRFSLYNADSFEAVKSLPESSIHYSIYSPPFCSLYTYSATERDAGNCRTHAEFYEHMTFLTPELLRVTKPGRLMSQHCMLLPTSKSRDGFIGLADFRGELIRAAVSAGWIFHSEFAVWKNPVTSMQRTKALGLLHKQLKKDACMSRQGINDYVITFRKPGINTEPVESKLTVEQWQRYASPTWATTEGVDAEGFVKFCDPNKDNPDGSGIPPGDTLQRESAREDDDERHICPLQLEIIRRCVRLWTNPDDVVLSPFAGIGSEGYVSIQEGRRFVGMELKSSYYKQAVANLRAASERGRAQATFNFDSPGGT